MASKRKTPNLPQQLRQLADAIEEATKPKRPMAPEERMVEFKKKSLKQRLRERRERLANDAEDDSDGEGGDNAAGQTLRPNRRPRPIAR